MKKMILMCTALICAGQLYGMSDVSKEVLLKRLLVSDNLKQFNVLMNALNTFPDIAPRETVAKAINTPTAKEYLEVNNKVVSKFAVNRLPFDDLKKAIEQDADVNFTYVVIGGNVRSILELACTHVRDAMDERDEELIKERLKTVYFLLTKGANPNVRSSTGVSLLAQEQHVVKKGFYGGDDRLLKLLIMFANKK